MRSLWFPIAMMTLLAIALVLLATPTAWAGGLDDCRGTVVIDSEMDPGTETIALKDKGEIKCLMAPVNSSEAKRFLKVCPVGTKCSVKYDNRGRSRMEKVK
jgi:hypothetical protein